MPISDSSVSWVRGRQAFSLIELAISVGIILILSSIILSYSRDSIKSIEMANQQAGLLSLIRQSKSLSQSFKNVPPSGKRICAYGVHVDEANGRAFIFQDLVDDEADCDSSDNAYTSGVSPSEELTGETNVFNVRPGFRFGSSRDVNSPNLIDVVFIPPDPQVVINRSSAVRSAVVVVEDAQNPDLYFSIKVNNFGQVNLE